MSIPIINIDGVKFSFDLSVPQAEQLAAAATIYLQEGAKVAASDPTSAWAQFFRTERDNTVFITDDPAKAAANVYPNNAQQRRQAEASYRAEWADDRFAAFATWEGPDPSRSISIPGVDKFPAYANDPTTRKNPTIVFTKNLLDSVARDSSADNIMRIMRDVVLHELGHLIAPISHPSLNDNPNAYENYQPYQQLYDLEFRHELPENIPTPDGGTYQNGFSNQNSDPSVRQQQQDQLNRLRQILREQGLKNINFEIPIPRNSDDTTSISDQYGLMASAAYGYTTFTALPISTASAPLVLESISSALLKLGGVILNEPTAQADDITRYVLTVVGRSARNRVRIIASVTVPA